MVYKVPDCAVHYFHAAVNPFETEAGACLPHESFPIPSSKVRTFARGTMQLGTSGFGFAVCTPLGGNDGALIQCTTSTSVGISSAAFNTYTNLQNINNTQGLYTTAQITGGAVAWRKVAVGIRCKYIGPLANRNGVTIAYEHPDHKDSRTLSWDTVNSNPNTIVQRVGSEVWDATVCDSGPVSPTELEYVNTATVQQPSADAAYLLIAVSGTAGDRYEVEAFQHAEYIGTTVPQKTASHADPASFSKIVETLKGQTAVKPLQPKDGPTLWERFKGFMSESLPSIVEVGAGVGNMLLGNEVGGAAMILDGGSKLIGGSYSPPFRLPPSMQEKVMSPIGRQGDRKALAIAYR